jgi:hypothetical protein
MASERPLARLHVEVHDDTGQRPVDFDVNLKSTAISGQIDTLGNYDSLDFLENRFVALPAGEYYVEVQSGRKTLGIRENFPASTVFAVGKGETRMLSMTARRGGFLRLSLCLPEGDDLEVWKGPTVETDFLSQPKRIVTSFRVQTEGGYLPEFSPPVGEPALCNLLFAPGSHVLTVSAEGFMPVQVSATIWPGEVTDIDVPMRRKE